MRPGKPLQRKTPLRASPYDSEGKRRYSTFAKPGKGLKRTRMKRKPVPKGSPGEEAYKRYVRASDCVCCGRPGPCDPAHMTLSADEKGVGMKVSNWQVVPLRRECHRAWDTHSGKFAGMSREARYEQAALWVEATRLAATPEGDRGQAECLEVMGLGRVVELEAGRWVWERAA